MKTKSSFHGAFAFRDIGVVALLFTAIHVVHATPIITQQPTPLTNSVSVGAALTNRRTLAPAETGLLTIVAIITICIAIIAAWFPRILAWPVAVLCGWLGVAWAWKAWTLWRKPATAQPGEPPQRGAPVPPSEHRARNAIIDNSRP